MAHILQGDWRSFVIRNGEATSDLSFHLIINDGGEIQAGSTHGGAAVTGNVVSGPHYHQIFINKANPLKKYRGVLLVSGPQLIICGVANLDPRVNFDGLSGLSETEIAAFFDQQQEVWVATKP